MPFEPDIVVTDMDSSQVLLIAEAKATEPGADSEEQLKHYLWKMGCPVGLLISPSQLSVYKNLFTAFSDDAVKRFGPYPAPSKWKMYASRGMEADFEGRVQSWLEGLKYENVSDWPKDAVDAIQRLVIPSLLHGEVRAAGPRFAR